MRALASSYASTLQAAVAVAVTVGSFSDPDSRVELLRTRKIFQRYLKVWCYSVTGAAPVPGLPLSAISFKF